MAVTETVKIVFEVDDKALVSTVQQLQAVGKVSHEDAAKFNALSQASKAAGASLDGASKGAKQFADSTKEVAKSAEQIKTVGTSLNTAGQSAKTASDGFVSLRTRLKEATLELQRLEDEFGPFSQEAVNARNKAGELADQFEDLQRQIRLTNPEGKVQAFQKLGQGIVGAFSVATGALQAFGAENEQVQQIASKLQGALNIAQGIQSIVGLKEAYEDVKVVLGFTTVAQETLTTATTAGKVATDGAALSTKGFAAALTSTGIGAIVVAIGALAAAYLLAADSTDKDTESEKKNKDTREKNIDALNEQINLLEAKREAEDKGIGAAQRDLELAKARGAQGRELFTAEQKTRQAELDALLRRQAFLGDDFKNEQERIALIEQIKNKRNEVVVAEIQFEREQREQSVENFKKSEEDKLKALEDNQAAIDAAYAAQQGLRQQFEQELANQLAEIDKKANVRKLVNQVQFYDDSQALAEANLIEEITAANNRIEKLKEFNQTGTDEYAAELAKRDKLNKDYDKLILDNKKKIANEENKIEKEKTDKAKEEAAKRTEIAIQAAQESFDFIFSLNSDRLQREQDDLEQQKEKGLITEEQYQEKLKQLKAKQARADKEAAIFNATIQFSQALINALTTTPATAAPAALALAAAVAGLNLAKIIATPLPKFKKGTLAVPGTDTGDDSVMAMLRPGEAVIPTEINREYASAIKAIYTRKVSSKDLNDFVNSRMSVVRDEPIFNFNPVTLDALYKRDLRISQMSGAVNRASGSSQSINIKANVDTNALGKVMSKNKSMEVANVESIGEAVAEALSRRTNRRQQI